MTIRRIVSLASRSIFRNKVRSFLTSLGIIIGVGSVIVMVAIGQGSQEQIRERIASMGTNLLMVLPARGPNQINRLTLDDITTLRNEASYLSATSGEVRLSENVVGGNGGTDADTYWSTSVFGVEPDYLSIKQWNVGTGVFFTEQEDSDRSKVAVLGSTVAAKLFGTSDPVGQTVRIGTAPFIIIGVLATKGSNGMGNDQDDVVMVPLETALTRLSQNRVLDSIQMSVVREDLMGAAQTEVTAILKQAHKIAATGNADFNVMNQSQIIETASSTASTLTSLLAAIAGVSLLVGGIGIMNIMLVSVTERTREIGIRMSVGARRRDILMQFLTEAIILSLTGGAIGILMAIGIVWGMSSWAHIAAIISPGIVVASAGFAAIVGIFFGYYPARKASNLYPIDALRYE
ncbi:MAG TPA: ABC transporter permease [Spirochaetia bacterium]|nr:ABC transporter permease [Spirochaetia bacterium]